MNEQTNEVASNVTVRNTLIATLIGRVTSDKMDKTVTVLVERRVKHALYGKVVTKSHKYHAHDEANECKTGDLVEIKASRKIAKTKAWVVSKVLEKTQVI